MRKKLLSLAVFISAALFQQSMAATFTVTNTNDSGAGSLRQAILDANAAAGADIIDFNIGAGGAQTITLSSFVDITSEIFVDGSSQPGFAGTPLISIAGTSMFRMTNASNSTISYLDLSGDASSTAIYAINTSNATFDNNDVSGSYYGIRFDGTSTNNVITNNNFSGAAQYGIFMNGGNNSGATITGNDLTNCSGWGLYYNYGTPTDVSGNDFTGSANAWYQRIANTFTIDAPGSGGVNVNTYGGQTTHVLYLAECSDITVQNWDFTPLMTTPASSQPLYCVTVSSSLFNNNNLSGMYYGIRFDGNCSNNTITNNDFSGAAQYGIFMNGGNNSGATITGNDLTNCSGWGLYFSYGTPADVSGNDFTGSANAWYQRIANTFTIDAPGSGGVNVNIYGGHNTHVLYLAECSDITVENWDFTPLMNTPASAQPLYCATVSSSLFNNNNSSGMYYGIRFDGNCANNTITNNNFSGAASNGIQMNGGNNSGAIVTGNDLTNCTGWGLWFNYGTPTDVSGNDFTGSANAWYQRIANTFTIDAPGSGGVNVNTYGGHTSHVLYLAESSDITVENWDFTPLVNTPASAQPLYCATVSSSLFNNNNSSGMYYGIRFDGNCSNNTITNNNFSGAASNGIQMNGGNNSGATVTGNDLTNCTGWGLWFNYGTPTDVSGNDFTGSGNAWCQRIANTFTIDAPGSGGVNVNTYGGHTSHVLYLAECSSITVENWDFTPLVNTPASAQPLYCSTVSSSLFNNNNLSGMYYGIRFDGNCSNNTITNNNFSGAASNGIFMNGGNNSGATITGNDLTNCTGWGLWFNYGTPTDVSGNDFTGSGNAWYQRIANTFTIDGPGSGGVNVNTYGGHTSHVLYLAECSSITVQDWDFPPLMSTPASSTPLYCTTVSSSLFDNNNISGTYYGIRFDGNCSNNTITNNNFSGAASNGIFMNGGNNAGATVTDNDLSNCAGWGLWYSYGTPADISNNDMSGSQNGLYLRIANTFTLGSNTYPISTGTGLQLESCTSVDVNNADIHGSAGTGIYINASNTCTINGLNSCGKYYGVRMVGACNGNNLLNSSIANSTEGIRLDNTSQQNTTIDNSNFFGNTTDINDNGTSTTITNSNAAASASWCPCTIIDQTVNTADFTTICVADTSIELASTEVGVDYYVRDDANDAIISGPVAGTGSSLWLDAGKVTSTTTFNMLSYNTGGVSDALQIDGFDGYVDCGNDASFDIQGDVTVEAWIYIDAFVPDWVRIAGKGNGANRTYGIWYNQNGEILWQMYGTSNMSLSSGAGAVVAGQWYHIAGVRSGSDCFLYLDGVQVGTTTYTGTAYLSTDPFTFGAANVDHSHHNGAIDEVRVWNVARSAADVNTYKDQCLAANETGLVAYYPIELGTGSNMVLDRAGSKHGSLTLLDASAAWVSGSTAVCGACTLEMADLVTVTIDPIADQSVAITDTELCPTNTGTTVTTGSSEAGVNYFLRDDANDTIVDGPLAGTGSGLTFNTGSLGSSMTYNVYTEADAYTNGLYFDGVDEYVTAGNVAVAGSGARTIDFWVKTTDVNGMMVSTGTAASSQAFNIRTIGGYVSFMGFGNDYNPSSGAIINDDAWHHVAVTYDGTNLIAYVDGVQDWAITKTLSTVGQNNFIGKSNHGSSPTYFDGMLDKVRYWNAALTPAEIATIMDNCDESFTTNLAHKYDLNEKSGSTTTESVASENGTLVNMEDGDWQRAQGCPECTLEMATTVSVTVQDIVAPVADVATLSDVTAECEVTALTAPTATDACEGAITGTHNATLPITTQGTTVVTWTYDDGNGNSSTQDQNVVIDDITAPTPDVATLSDVTAECEVTALVAPTATDNCGGTVTVTHNATLPITTQGTTVVTWSYDDGNGNISTQDQNVVIDDVTAPTPDVATLADVTNECEVTALVAPTATDNCGGTVTVTHNATLPITTQGTTVVTWSYDDGNGNVSTQDQNVVIDDVTAPVPDAASLADVTDECSITTSNAPAAPTATDNCGGTITGVPDVALPITTQGTTVVTWTFDDGNGNSSTQTQNVIIDDVTAPTPDLATLADVTDECSVTSLTAPTATDNCAGAVTVTHNATLPITTQGTTVVTWSYDDGNGNISTQDQNVVIDDVTAPTPDVATLADVTDECSVTSLAAPTATDNCGGTVTVTHNATLPITTQGTTVVTWSYDDGNGNVSTQDQNVVINDVTPPSISAPADVNTLANAASCEASGVSLGTETTSDNCGGTVTVSNDAPATFPLGTTTVTWTAMDAEGNSATAVQLVTVTTDLAVVTDSIHDALCADSLNGQAFVTVTGGTTAYSFEWDHDGTGDNDDMEDQDGLLAGNYNLVVTDANGCTAATTASINEPMPLVASNTSVDPTTCTSGDGSVDASVTGGTMPMDYLWDNSATTEDLSGLTAGVYVLVVTDANGCMSTTSATLSDPAGPVVVLDSIHDNVCFGDAAGELFTTVSGGTGALTYDWDNDGTGDADDADDVSGLAAGTYNLTVVDAAGCTGTTSGTVMDPAAITSTPSTTPVSCFGGADGTAVLTTGGGTGTLVEDWGTANPSALAAGVTSYTITDDNGCVFNGDVTITQPDSLELTIAYNAILCNGDSTDIDVEVIGGTANYSYDWDADGYDDAQDSLGADNGTYTVMVMDANGCTIDSTFTIDEPTALSLSTVGTDEMNGNDGMIDLTVTGGTATYTYDWSNSATTEDVSGLVAGTYDVIVTDANGCMDSISTTIDTQVSVVENNGIVINVYPNPSNGIINVSFTEVMEGEIKVFDAIGKLVMNQPINELLMEINLNDEERGIYFMSIENADFQKTIRIVLH